MDLKLDTMLTTRLLFGIDFDNNLFYCNIRVTIAKDGQEIIAVAVNPKIFLKKI